VELVGYQPISFLTAPRSAKKRRIHPVQSRWLSVAGLH
jgi:hypothetical protein